MEEGFVRAVHTGTGLEQDIPLNWFDAFPGQWREAGAEVEAPVAEPPVEAEPAVATPPAVVAPAVPAPATAPATAPAPEGDAA